MEDIKRNSILAHFVLRILKKSRRRNLKESKNLIHLTVEPCSTITVSWENGNVFEKKTFLGPKN